MQVVTCKNAFVSAKLLKANVPKDCIVKMRQRLIEAARIEFGEKGIECATTRGIAERAECNEVTLFRHFESKQKLLAAVVKDTTDDFHRICTSPDEMTGDLHADLGHFASVYNRSLERCEGMARALIGEGRRRPNLAKELIGDVVDPFHQSIACYLTEKMKQGEVRADLEPEVFAELFTATLMSGMLRRTSGLSQLDGDAWIAGTVEVFFKSIAVVK